MPQPLSRLFPKISAKSDSAQLVLHSNAIATLLSAPTRPTFPAPRNLPIVVHRSFRFIIRVNIPYFSRLLLCNHLQQALASHASNLGITSVNTSEDHVLLVETTDLPPRTQSHLPTAVLDYITLDYRFTRRSPDFDEFIKNTSENAGLFLPLRQLLEDVVQKLICVHLVRQLPDGFGSRKNTLSNELILADSTSRHINRILSFSRDDAFHRKVQKQLGRINTARIRDQQEVNAQLGIADNPDNNVDSDGEEATGEQLDLQSLISFAINKTFTVNIRPKALKPTSRPSNEQADRLDLLDELDLESQSMEDLFTSQALNDGVDEESELLNYEEGDLEFLDDKDDELLLSDLDDTENSSQTQVWYPELDFDFDSPPPNDNEDTPDAQDLFQYPNAVHPLRRDTSSDLNASTDHLLNVFSSTASPDFDVDQDVIELDFDLSATEDPGLDLDDAIDFDVDLIDGPEGGSLPVVEMSSSLPTPELSNSSQTDAEVAVFAEFWFDEEGEHGFKGTGLNDIMDDKCGSPLRSVHFIDEILELDSP